MRLKQIQDFVVAIEAGSISAAARTLGASQPALTKSIGTLEAELKLPLIQRTSRGVLLTEYGQAFYARARAACSELEKARHELQQLAGDRTGRVAVGFGPLAAVLLLPEAVVRFQQRFPECEVRLIEGFAHVTMPLVRNETLDMAIAPRLPGIREDKALRFRPIFHNNQVIVGRRGHPRADARSIAELAGTKWLSFEPRGVADQTLAGLGLPAPRHIMQCESLHVLLALLANSDMLAVLSRRVLAMPQASNALREISIAERTATMTTGLYSRSDAPLTPPAALMAKILVEIGRGLSGSA